MLGCVNYATYYLMSVNVVVAIRLKLKGVMVGVSQNVKNVGIG